MARLARFLTRYYVLNLLVASTYFIVRRFYPKSDIHARSEFMGFTRVRRCGCGVVAGRDGRGLRASGLD